MSNNTENVSSHWAGFRRIWWIIAILLFLLLLLLWLLGYGPGGKKCEVPPTIIEKTVEVEKLVDNPKLLSRIGLLEKDNSAIVGLRSKISELQNLPPKIVEKTIEVEKLVDNPKLLDKISLLEKDNARIAGLLVTIKGLETDNGQIAGLKTKIAELENAEPKIKIVEKIVEKIIRVPVAPDAPVMPVPPVRTMSLPDTAKLYFDVGSAEFPADVNLSLSATTAYLRNNVESKAVISGFHDSTGSLVANQELSIKRAQAVAKLLLDSGIAIDRMTIQKPTETTGTGSPEEARRVEVKVMR